MEWVVVIGLAAIAFFMFGKKKEKKAEHAFDALRAISPMLANEGFDTSNVTFTTYEDRRLMEGGGNILIVGTGRRFYGDMAGFISEMSYSGPLQFRLLYPSGIATWHKLASHEALQCGASLYARLKAREDAHHQKYNDETKSATEERLAAAFARRKIYFRDLEASLRKALISEATLFDRPERIAEMFCDIAGQIAAMDISFQQKTTKLSSLWDERVMVLNDAKKLVTTGDDPEGTSVADEGEDASDLEEKSLVRWRAENTGISPQNAAKLVNSFLRWQQLQYQSETSGEDVTDWAVEVTHAFAYGAILTGVKAIAYEDPNDCELFIGTVVARYCGEASQAEIDATWSLISDAGDEQEYCTEVGARWSDP